MEMKVIEDKKARMMFQIVGENHLLANILKDELQHDEHVKAVGYYVEHPLIGKPCFVLETDGVDCWKTISSAVKRLSKTTDKLKDELKELRY